MGLNRAKISQEISKATNQTRINNLMRELKRPHEPKDRPIKTRKKMIRYNGISYLDGLPLQNMDDVFDVDITQKDIDKASPCEPMTCAFAIAIRRITGCPVSVGARIVLIRREKYWERREVSSTSRRAILNFDRSGKCEPGIYTLIPFRRYYLGMDRVRIGSDTTFRKTRKKKPNSKVSYLKRSCSNRDIRS